MHLPVLSWPFPAVLGQCHIGREQPAEQDFPSDLTSVTISIMAQSALWLPAISVDEAGWNSEGFI